MKEQDTELGKDVPKCLLACRSWFGETQNSLKVQHKFPTAEFKLTMVFSIAQVCEASVSHKVIVFKLIKFWHYIHVFL